MRFNTNMEYACKNTRHLPKRAENTSKIEKTN
jgi:hypothetical protein